MLLKTLFFSIVFSLFSLNAFAQESGRNILDGEFQQTVTRTLDNIRAAAGKPLSPFKKPREANQNIITAMELIQIDQNYEEGRKHLIKAISINKDNFFAYLLVAITLELENKTIESTPYYLGFLKQSVESSVYEHGILITPQDIRLMRAHVRELLLKRNVNISEGIDNLDLSIPRFSLFAFWENKELFDVTYDTLFLFFIIIGLIYYFYRKNEGPSYFSKWESILFKLVWCGLFIGLLEIIQLLFPVPYLFTPLTQRTLLLVGLAGGYIILSQLKESSDIREALKNPQYRQCPHCKKIVPKINVECPNCKKHIQ